MSRSGRSEAVATPLVCLVLAAALAACSDGYPRDDVELPHPSAGRGRDSGSAAAVVERLNLMNQNSLTTTHWTFTLTGPCTLRLDAQRPDGGEQVMKLGLLHSDMQVKGNVGGPIHAVQVEFSGAPELGDEHLFEAERWTDAVEFATHLQALQRICAARHRLSMTAATPATIAK